MSNILINPLPNRQYFYENHANYYSPFRGLFILEDIFQGSLTDANVQVETPSEIKVPLRMHQKAMVAAMEKLETDGVKGRKVDNETLYTNTGILGDRVGMGKSLTVLAHIARMKNSTTISYNNTSLNQSPSVFSIKEYTITDLSSSTLVIVPHNLYRQWQDYIEEQTTLKAC
jgi:SNF2 family DNA or RNA helicase